MGNARPDWGNRGIDDNHVLRIGRISCPVLLLADNDVFTVDSLCEITSHEDYDIFTPTFTTPTPYVFMRFSGIHVINLTHFFDVVNDDDHEYTTFSMIGVQGVTLNNTTGVMQINTNFVGQPDDQIFYVAATNPIGTSWGEINIVFTS